MEEPKINESLEEKSRELLRLRITGEGEIPDLFGKDAEEVYWRINFLKRNKYITEKNKITPRGYVFAQGYEEVV